MNTNLPDLNTLIQALGLQPLPVEGGLFRETYRSAEQIVAGSLGTDRPPQDRACGTAILYLLSGQPGSFSALHRLPTDEVWHFYLGDPLEMTLLLPDGSTRQVTLGQDILSGQQVQFTVPAGAWQGTRLRDGGRYALVGTSMSPGFATEDYENGIRQALLDAYPQAANQIISLTRGE